MKHEIRPPWTFGNHDSNAEVRYVEVIEILEDPPEEGDEDYDPEAIIPYQPVRVKRLLFGGHVPASVVIETDNSDVVIRTRKSGERHGERGNGVDVTFEIDSGVTADAEAEFDGDDAILAIKVKNDEVLWQAVAEAVAVPLHGAFILSAEDPAAEVGAAIGSESGTLGGGEDGEYAVAGEEFGIGDHDSKEGRSVGDKLWVILRKDSQRWEILTGSGGGSSDLRFGKLTTALSAAEDWGDLGSGMVQEKNVLSGDDIGGEREIKTPFFEGQQTGIPVWFIEQGDTLILVRPGCTAGP